MRIAGCVSTREELEAIEEDVRRKAEEQAAVTDRDETQR
jgi:hypothetical protein